MFNIPLPPGNLLTKNNKPVDMRNIHKLEGNGAKVTLPPF